MHKHRYHKIVVKNENPIRSRQCFIVICTRLLFIVLLFIILTYVDNKTAILDLLTILIFFLFYWRYRIFKICEYNINNYNDTNNNQNNFPLTENEDRKLRMPNWHLWQVVFLMRYYRLF